MKPANSHPKRIFKGFGGHKNLCVCKALEDYLQKTASLNYGEANLFGQHRLNHIRKLLFQLFVDG